MTQAEQDRDMARLVEVLLENGFDCYSEQPVHLTEDERQRVVEIIKQYAPKHNEEGWIVLKPKR